MVALIDPGEHGYELRQNTPFTGVLPDEERLAAVRRASREHRHFVGCTVEDVTKFRSLLGLARSGPDETGTSSMST